MTLAPLSSLGRFATANLLYDRANVVMQSSEDFASRSEAKPQSKDPLPVGSARGVSGSSPSARGCPVLVSAHFGGWPSLSWQQNFARLPRPCLSVLWRDRAGVLISNGRPVRRGQRHERRHSRLHLRRRGPPRGQAEFPQPIVTSNLAHTQSPAQSWWGRGGWQNPIRRAPNSFVSKSLISKVFYICILRGISR